MSRFLTNWAPISKTDAEDIIHTAFVFIYIRNASRTRPERNCRKKGSENGEIVVPICPKIFSVS
jgi:hypothetical protein